MMENRNKISLIWSVGMLCLYKTWSLEKGEEMLKCLHFSCFRQCENISSVAAAASSLALHVKTACCISKGLHTWKKSKGLRVS